MENENTGTETVESIDAQINELRTTPAYNEPFRSGTIAQKEVQAKIHGLYEKKRELAGNVADSANVSADDGNRGVRETSFNPVQQGKGDLQAQAQAEFDKLEALGVDISQEDTEGMTNERLEGIQQMRLIEEGDFQTVAPMLSKAAIRAGLPTEDISMIRQILPRFKDPDAKPIVVAIANYIYNKRTQGS